jgi:flagellar biogenesis protein FliO
VFQLGEADAGIDTEHDQEAAMTNGDYFFRLAGGLSLILYFVVILLWAGYQFAVEL